MRHIEIQLTGAYEDADIFTAPVQGLMLAVPRDGSVPPMFIVAGGEVTPEMREEMARTMEPTLARFGAANPREAAREEVAEMEARAFRDPSGDFLLLTETEWMTDAGLASIRERD